jgi:hypothetical protein
MTKNIKRKQVNKNAGETNNIEMAIVDLDD